MTPSGLLQREKFIRIAGVFLTLSPFFNLYFSISSALGSKKLTSNLFDQIIKNISVFFWLTAVVAIVTGLMMLKGRRSSWLSVMGLLGVFIVFNIVNIKTDLATGWLLPTVNLLTNLSLFALVYSQEFHQVAQRKGLELIRKMRESKPNGPTINFEGVGPWAKLIAITTTHMSIRAFATPPEDIQTRILEVALATDLVLRARFIQLQDNNGKPEYFFELIEMDAKTRYRLEDWLVLKKYARFSTPQAA